MITGGVASCLLMLVGALTSVEASGGDSFDRAQWIWCGGEAAPQNFYLYLRKAFTLSADVESATMHVTADSRYKLFVNGEFVGRGPVRCDQRWQYYDTYDIAAHLRQGENVIGAIVHQFGVPSHSYTLGRGGFLLQGEVVDRTGTVTRLDTNETWRVLPAPAWDRESSKNCTALTWMEIYDARKEPRGWKLPRYDDSIWQKPVLLGKHPTPPWENLVPRAIPVLLEEERFPTTIVNIGVVDPAALAVRLDVAKILGRSDGRIVYVLAYLKSPIDQEAALVLRGRPAMPPMVNRTWLNGRAVGPRVELKRGWNELLVKLGRWSPVEWFGTLSSASWYWELALGPSRGQEFVPVEWHARPDPDTPPGRAQIFGPYGQDEPESIMDWVKSLGTAYEPEQIILERPPGTTLDLEGKEFAIDFGNPKNVALQMAMERRRPEPTPALRNVEKLLRNGDGATIVCTADSDGDPYVTVDFGKEVSGYVRLRLNGVAGGIVDLGYCEKLVDGHVDVLREAWSFADRYIMRDGPQEWELFFWKGFRYLQLTFRNCPRPVEVESVSLLFTSYPVEYRGSFECSDPLLTRIWHVGRWTLQMCMHDAYEDCPWREQGQWCGDAEVEIKANYVTFGDVALATQCLRQFAQGQNEQGAMPQNYPADRAVHPIRQPVSAGANPYMAQWVGMLLDHYRYTGDVALVSELYPNLAAVIACFDRSLQRQGAQPSTMHAHYYKALIDGATLAGVLGKDARRTEWLDKAEQMKRAERGPEPSPQRGRPAPPRLHVSDTVLGVYAGLVDPEPVSASLATLYQRLDQRPVQLMRTTFFQFFYLQALRNCGLHQEALDAIRKTYGKMLEAGATTWWETLSGDNSLCHAWGAAPNYDLSSYVLGVQVTEPRFTAFRVEPFPADLTWAKGTVPTVRGDIEVAWKREGESFELSVDVPFEARVELSVPAENLEKTKLSGKRKAERREFKDGHARYWVMGPCRYGVVSLLSSEGE